MHDYRVFVCVKVRKKCIKRGTSSGLEKLAAAPSRLYFSMSSGVMNAETMITGVFKSSALKSLKIVEPSNVGGEIRNQFIL